MARAEVERLRAALLHRCVVEHVEPGCVDCQAIIKALDGEPLGKVRRHG